MSGEDDCNKIFNLSLDLICIADLKFHMFEKVNPSFARTLGYSIGELEGKPYLDFVHPGDIEATENVVKEQLLQGREVLDFQNRHICKNGSIIWLQWRTRPDLENMKLYAIARDITLHRQRRYFVNRAEKMLSLGNLAAGLAHELNNPLAGIVNSNQVLTKRLDPTLSRNRALLEDLDLDPEAFGTYMINHEINELNDSIRLMTRRASDIISTLFAFLNYEEEKSHICKLSDLLDEATETVANAMSGEQDINEIEIIRDYSSPVPGTLCDRTNMVKAFKSLIRNAYESLLSVPYREHRRIKLNIGQELDSIAIRIEDNGIGISEENIGRIFEPFFTTHEVGQGLGLGLSSAYFIVTTMHRGKILVSSTENEGALFTVILPVE